MFTTFVDAKLYNASRNRNTQCPAEGRVVTPKRKTPQGWPETEVLVLQEMPRSIWPWALSASGLLLRRSLKRSGAIVAIKKQPKVITSSNEECSDTILSSQEGKGNGCCFRTFEWKSSLRFEEI